MTYIIGAVVVLVVLLIGRCELYEREAIKEMIMKGVDPVRANCAFVMSDRDKERCMILLRDTHDPTKQ